MNKQTKKLYLMGWYGKGGLADDIIAECIKKGFFEEARKKNIGIDFVEKINESELVVIGGGSLLGFDVLKLNKKLKKIDKPVVIFGGGYRREKRVLDEKNMYESKNLLSKVALCGVRGYVSKQMFLQNRLIEDDEIEVIGDPAILFDPVPVEEFEGVFKVGMVVRNVSFLETQYSTNKLIQANFANLADFLTQKYNAKIYFMSFTENFLESDIKGAEKTIELMKYKTQAEILPREKDCVKLGSMIGKMDLVVSQRLHPSLLAWVQGVPSIAFEYQFNKTVDVMNSIGMDEFVIRTDEFSMDGYIKKLDRLMQDKPVIMSQAKISIDYWKNKLSSFFERSLALIS